MLTAVLRVAMVLGLSLSATAAIAEPVPVRQQIAPTHMDVASSNGPRDRSAPTATDEEQRTASDTQVTQSADSDPEPESISGGTEP